jgi:putative transposase
MSRWVFSSEGIEIVPTPFQTPNANAIAGRRVRTVREECLDQLIILNERHLQRVLAECQDCFNEQRPYQGPKQDSPLGLEPIPVEGHMRWGNWGFI